MIVATTAPAAVAAEPGEPTEADVLEAVEKIEDRLILGISETQGDTQAVLLDVLVGVQSFSLDDCTNVNDCIDELIETLWPVIQILVDIACILVDIAQIIIDLGLTVVALAQAFVDAVVEEVCMAYNGDPDCVELDEAVTPIGLELDTKLALCAASST